MKSPLFQEKNFTFLVYKNNLNILLISYNFTDNPQTLINTLVLSYNIN